MHGINIKNDIKLIINAYAQLNNTFFNHILFNIWTSKAIIMITRPGKHALLLGILRSSDISPSILFFICIVKYRYNPTKH